MPGLTIEFHEGKNSAITLTDKLVMRQTGDTLARDDYARLQDLHERLIGKVVWAGSESFKENQRTRVVRLGTPPEMPAVDRIKLGEALVKHYQKGMAHCGLKVKLVGFPEPTFSPVRTKAPEVPPVAGAFEGFEARLVRLQASGHDIKLNTRVNPGRFKPYTAVISRGAGADKRWAAGAGYAPNEALYNAEVNFRRALARATT